MAAYYKAGRKYDEIREWYDGYRFGKTDIYNSWSVINYFRSGCKPEAFWLSTDSNDLIGELLEAADDSVYDSLKMLLQGQTITTGIDTNVIYPQIREKPSSLFSFLLVSGYLKAVKSEIAFNGEYICELAVPNREITYVYNREIIERMIGMIRPQSALDIQMALYKGNADELRIGLQKMLTQSVSYFDTQKESFYHGLVLGLCAVMDNRYEITSNREAGDGRLDICMKPGSKLLPGILIELKATDKPEALERKADDALKQIDVKNYTAAFAGIDKVWKYGVAFSGKHVAVALG